MTPFIRFILSSAFFSALIFIYFSFIFIDVFFGNNYRDNFLFYTFIALTIFMFLLLLNVLNINNFNSIKIPKKIVIFFLLFWIVRKFVFLKMGFMGGFVLTGFYYYPLGIIFLPLLVLLFNTSHYEKKIYYFLLFNMVLILEFLLFITLYWVKLFFDKSNNLNFDPYLNVGFVKLITYHLYYYFSFLIGILLYIVFIFNFGEKIRSIKFPRDFFNLINMISAVLGGFIIFLLLIFG